MHITHICLSIDNKSISCSCSSTFFFFKYLISLIKRLTPRSLATPYAQAQPEKWQIKTSRKKNECKLFMSARTCVYAYANVQNQKCDTKRNEHTLKTGTKWKKSNETKKHAYFIKRLDHSTNKNPIANLRR